MLAWLVHPVGAREFESTYYEKRVLVVRRDDPAYYRSLMSLADLDHVLGTHALKHPELDLTCFGRDIKAADYTNEGFIDPPRVAQQFAGGATLIFSHLHARLPALADLCLRLNRRMSSRMQTNIYLTPAGAQGFPPHWDTHDTLILQVEGSKHWTIYDTKIELPLKGQPFDSKRDVPGPPTMEFDLRAGDMAYVPRGAMHAARSTGEVSLHVTVGVIAYTWADMLIQAVVQAAANDVRLRQNLPIGFDRPDFQSPGWAALLEERLALVRERAETRAPLGEFADAIANQNRECPTNLLQQVARAHAISSTSRVRTRADVAWSYDEDAERCALTGLNRRVAVPLFAAPALRHVMGTPSFVVSELPDCLDGEGKLTLVRRLVREGLVECVGD